MSLKAEILDALADEDSHSNNRRSTICYLDDGRIAKIPSETGAILRNPIDRVVAETTNIEEAAALGCENIQPPTFHDIVFLGNYESFNHSGQFDPVLGKDAYAVVMEDVGGTFPKHLGEIRKGYHAGLERVLLALIDHDIAANDTFGHDEISLQEDGKTIRLVDWEHRPIVQELTNAHTHKYAMLFSWMREQKDK